jgi:Zn-dependent metalloprotease
MKQALRILTIALTILTASTALAVAQPEPAAVAQLRGVAVGGEVGLSAATGAVRFARLRPETRAGLGPAAAPAALEAHVAEFFDQHGAAFGVGNARTDLNLERVYTDRLGQTHLTYTQEYGGLPVFGAVLRAHFDAAGKLRVVNGTAVPDILVSTVPARGQAEAAQTAVGFVEGALGTSGLAAQGSRLLVYREGLARGVPGENHLAWEVEVGNGGGVREFVYVDAGSGKVVDQITGIHDGLDRRAFDAMGFNAPGPNYPDTPFWVEGDPLPTSSTEADNMILASGETYAMFWNGFGRDSFDGAGGTMDSIFNRGNGCPNASWNGVFISFCPGTTSDDVTAHEWGHAYTDYTHDLIYQWQPGALNESYSDIWGETVDFLNGRGTDSPGGARSAAACTVFTVLPPSVTVNAPPSIAGVKRAGSAAFGPTAFSTTADVILADDGAGTTSDGCEPFVNGAAVAGRIALVDRGACTFTSKVKNAQNAGAVGAIVANNSGGTAVINMGGSDATIVIPSLFISQNDGADLHSALLSSTVNASLDRGASGTDNSVRWLTGEDATAFGGAIRDMWNPGCYGDPGRVSDLNYTCASSDSGGVHSNSGVPNHAFALLVDGGTYNGHTVGAIGLTKAAHVYYRAAQIYQGPASNFADHADALEASCADLVGVDLHSLTSGAPSGEIISSADCDQVAAAAAAVELRTPPSQCGFEPLLAQDPPALCPDEGFPTPLFHDFFESGRSATARASLSHEGETADFTPREWQVVSNLPDGRAGRAFFGIDPNIGTCGPGGDETAVLHMDTPQISVPASVTAPMLTFDHWVATEPRWDGGNLKISVNGGPWQLVEAADFVYNPYNTTLFTAGQGNTNPIAGEPAFSGTDEGAVDGTWGRSIVDLAPYAGPQDKIRLRFDIGNDGCSGRFGWYIDDLMVYKCH